MKFKIKNPFKRKTDPKLQDVIDDKRKATQHMWDVSEKIRDIAKSIKVERRCGIEDEYAGPERRQVHA